MDRYLAHLATVPLFRDCRQDDLKAIARCGTDIVLEAGQELTTQDRAGYEFFVIVSGTVEVVRGGRVVAVLGPGDHVGELALLGAGPRNATVTATSNVAAIVVQSNEFRGLLERAPGLSYSLLTRLAGRLADQDRSGVAGLA